MIWFLLSLAVVTGIFIDYCRLVLLGLLAMAITAYPQVMLPSIGAVIWWAVKTNVRR